MDLGRRLKSALAHILGVTGTGALADRWRDSCAVFAFHRITDPDSPATYSSSTESLPLPLFAHLAALIREEYCPLSYSEFEAHVRTQTPFARRSCLITFDDGWRDNYTHAWPVLREYQLPALIFLPTSFISSPRQFWQDELYAAFLALREKRKHGPYFFDARALSDIVYDLLEDPDDRVWFYTREAVQRLKDMDPRFTGPALRAVLEDAFPDARRSPAGRSFLSRQEIAEMAKGGVHFGSHSVHHRILPGLSEEDLAFEVIRSRQDIAELAGYETTAFSYPNGDFDERVVTQVERAGYATGFTIDYGTVRAESDPFRLRRIDMTAEMLALPKGRFSPALFAIETTPAMLTLKRRRQNTVRPVPMRDRRIRLLYLIDSMQGEAGTEMQIVNLIRRLPPGQFDVHLACFVVSEWLRSRNLPCRLYDLDAPSFWRPSAYLNTLRFIRFLRAAQIDIVQTFFPAAHVVGVAAAFLARVPRIVTSRRNFGYALTTMQRWTMNVLNRRTHRILANSFAVKQRTVQLEGAHARLIDVIYNGVDLSPFAGRPPAARPRKADLGFAEDQSVVGIVANLRPVKGVRYFVEAAGIIVRSHPDTQFVVLGYGELIDELRRLAAEVGVADRVHFRGRTPQVIDHLRLFDVAVLSSLSEGFSNSILEYMAAGLPVVATNVGSNWEAVVDGVTGFLARTQDPEDLARKIIVLLNNPALRRRMGEAGRERVKRHFSMERMVERYDEYYRYVMVNPFPEPRFKV